MGHERYKQGAKLAQTDRDRNLSRCPECGKWQYQSKRDARRAARQTHPGRLMRAYRCGNYWHLTSQDSATTEQYRQYLR